MGNQISIVHSDQYPNETVAEIIEHCRKTYFEKGCDKFKDFTERRHYDKSRNELQNPEADMPIL